MEIADSIRFSELALDALTRLLASGTVCRCPEQPSPDTLDAVLLELEMREDFNLSEILLRRELRELLWGTENRETLWKSYLEAACRK